MELMNKIEQLQWNEIGLFSFWILQRRWNGVKSCFPQFWLKCIRETVTVRCTGLVLKWLESILCCGSALMGLMGGERRIYWVGKTFRNSFIQHNYRFFVDAAIVGGKPLNGISLDLKYFNIFTLFYCHRSAINLNFPNRKKDCLFFVQFYLRLWYAIHRI